MQNKKRELDFIKGYSKISVNKICKKLNINRSNLVNGKVNSEKTHAVYIFLVDEITEMIKEVITNE